jgi:hypothetical protein
MFGAKLSSADKEVLPRVVLSSVLTGNLLPLVLNGRPFTSSYLQRCTGIGAIVALFASCLLLRLLLAIRPNHLLTHSCV